MFRGKESSNRIELSRLVQELLNFGVSGSLQLWGVWGWVDRGGGGWIGVGMVGGCPPHMCTHMCMHAHTCMRGKHENFMQMATPLGESMGIPYDVICTSACVHMHACAHVCGAPPQHPHPHPHPPTPPPPRGEPLDQSKFNST